MQKGDLLKSKSTGELATIISKPFTKLFRDASDWEAARHGFDCATAATAIRIMFLKNGFEKTFKQSTLRRNFEVIEDSNCEEKSK
ncbi:MAG: hypothetical protein CBC29_07335 [Methylococcaceae bacterium TMED69]|nr:MAG: hypothetical protein CBC29_05515 [Methylococcaceae bacterium TMED69]OUU74933.1 MAG: hypothetical protein CBC29_07335 [Methylococcaceae bacterium TMED69]|tara:strand:+ start:516 stop:770 length:255 start_codon:yes stop_codon:yes gene_type:complete